MASFRTLKSGRINVQVRQAGLHPISATFGTQREAEAWAAKHEMSVPEPKKAGKDEHTLGSIARLYCDRQLFGKRSRHLMDLRYRRMVKFFPQPFLEITRLDINTYKNRRMKEVAGSTVREEIQSINKLFRWAEREMIFGDDPLISPAGNIALPPASKPLNRVVERQELEALLSDLNPMMAEVVEMAWETAMRRAEITRLTVQSIDLEARTAQVVDGKTGDRIVPLTLRATEILKGAQERCSHEESRLFPLSPHSVSTAVRRARKRIGLGTHVRMHQLRHTRITEVARRGFNQAQIMMVSGH